MSKRGHISLRTKLAAAVRDLLQIPYEHAKLMTEDQVLSLVQWDHGILHGVEVNNEHWNLTPRTIMAHREKSKTDTGIVAKVVRIEKKWAPVKAAIESGQKPPKRVSKHRWPKGRKIESRGFGR